MPGDQSNPARFIAAKEETCGLTLRPHPLQGDAATQEERVSRRVGVRI